VCGLPPRRQEKEGGEQAEIAPQGAGESIAIIEDYSALGKDGV
jgi:hypothetical protein